MAKCWKVLGYDPNGSIFECVTAEYAEGIEVGDEIIAVWMDTAPLEDSAWRYLDEGHAVLARVTKKTPTAQNTPGIVVIHAEMIQDD